LRFRRPNRLQPSEFPQSGEIGLAFPFE
jgi:hypothetical protein